MENIVSCFLHCNKSIFSACLLAVIVINLFLVVSILSVDVDDDNDALLLLLLRHDSSIDDVLVFGSVRWKLLSFLDNDRLMIEFSSTLALLLLELKWCCNEANACD